MTKTLIWILFQSLLSISGAVYRAPDHTPLIVLNYNEQNVTIYASASNPSRDPKQWVFWYDPILKYDSLKDIHQFNEYVRFQFSFFAPDFDQIARTAIVKLMHPDTERFALFWLIEPLPIDTLNVYIINQKGQPVPSVYPCTKSFLHGTGTYECQCQSSSMIAANWIKDSLVCGKYQLQFDYYIQSSLQPIVIPPSLITPMNLNNLRAAFDANKYLHPRQENDFVARYVVQLQAIDNTIKEARVQKLFRTMINVIGRYEVKALSDLWFGEQLENLINQDVFHMSLRGRNQLLFHLKSSNSPWMLTSSNKQTFNVTEMQALLFEQLKIRAEWLPNERWWRVKSVMAHRFSDVLDFLQVILINQQHAIDKANATAHRIIDCTEWSKACVCQSTVPALVFTTSAQLLRISNFDFDLSRTGFTFELRIRPDALATEIDTVHILNFRGEYHLTYQPKGEIIFSVIEEGQSYLYTTSLQSISLKKWTHVAGIYSVSENQLQLYINGEFISSILHSKKTLPLMNDIILGQNFLGAMRDFRVWACPLTAEAVYHSMGLDSLNGNETCLLGYWPMNEGTGPIITDLIATYSPHPGTLGLDENPSFTSDPIWAVVLPKPALPSEPPVMNYRMFRINITSPFVVRWGSPYDQPTPGDFDGDGLADFGVYRTIASTWIIAPSSNPNIMLTKVWGLATDRPFPANFDGDKYSDYVFFRPATGEWIAQLTSNPNYIFTHRWGRPGDSPCPGDFDGDGKADFVVYRSGAFYINPSTDPSIQWTKQWGQLDDRPVPACDFDGDGRTDFTVWSPSTAIWSWIPSSAPWLIYQKQWGFTLDRPFCGDYDGDKLRDFVAYRNWTGEWFVLPTRLATFLITFQWGYPTDIPVGGDYDGDGRGDFGLWRPRRNRSYVWEIIPSTMPVALLRKGWGIENDQPVIGDFDRDKRSDFTVWRPTTGFWYILLIGSPGIQQIKHWGFSFNDTALAADWDGDLFTDYTIYRPTTGFWHIMLSRNPILQIFMQWGVPQFEDVGVPGDFDGDGKFDFAVWRPSTGVWFILPSTNPSQVIISQWGIKGDIPVTGVDFDGDGKTDIAVWRPSTGSWYILPSSNPIYPFFGPSLIRQPKIEFPPPPTGASTPSPPEEPKATSTATTTEASDYA